MCSFGLRAAASQLSVIGIFAAAVCSSAEKAVHSLSGVGADAWPMDAKNRLVLVLLLCFCMFVFLFSFSKVSGKSLIFLLTNDESD